MNNLNVNFIEEIEGTYVVRVEINDKSFVVNCQTVLDRNQNETDYLDCVNDSGGDIYDSGLAGYLEKIGFDSYSEEFKSVEKLIEAAAEEIMPVNTVERVLQDELCDSTIKEVKALFGAFGPSDVHHVKFINDESEVIVASIDVSENKAENMLLGYKEFENEAEYEMWSDEIYDVDRYGECNVSYRAYKNICE